MTLVHEKIKKIRITSQILTVFANINDNKKHHLTVIIRRFFCILEWAIRHCVWIIKTPF